MTPSFSIVTPTLNCGATIGATLASLRPLVEAGAEHVVVDSGSTDGTVELATQAGARVIQHPRGNMYGAINAGVIATTGEWVTYVNGDDVLYSDATADSLRNSAGNAEVLYGNIDYIDDVGRFLFSWRSPSPARLRTLMAHYSAVPQQGTLFRRSVFDRLGGFDVRYRYSADYDFWARALLGGFRFLKFTATTVAGFRLMATQLSQSRKAEMAPEGLEIRRRLRQGRNPVALFASAVGATLYRRALNGDNYFLRQVRGRGLDRR